MTVFRRDQGRIEAWQASALQKVKTEAVAAINAASGLTRQKFITTAPGQEMIYLAKEREAIAYLADPVPLPIDYPLIAAEVGVTAPTAWELAQVWVNVSVYWRSIAARIEGARMRAIARIEAAPDADAAQVAAAAFRPL